MSYITFSHLFTFTYYISFILSDITVLFYRYLFIHVHLSEIHKWDFPTQFMATDVRLPGVQVKAHDLITRLASGAIRPVTEHGDSFISDLRQIEMKANKSSLNITVSPMFGSSKQNRMTT